MFGLTRLLGDAGERAARRFLRQAGIRLIERNFRCAAGEIDLICDDAGTIVFVEVKTRRSEVATDPENAIGPGKQCRIEAAARTWIKQHHYPERAYRFDSVAIVWPADGKPQVRHVREAWVPRR